MEEIKNCCEVNRKNFDKPSQGIISGIFYGFLAHSFCIIYIIFSVAGITVGTLMFRKFFLMPYFFHFLVFASFALATASAVIYLKKIGMLSFEGAQKKWKYLAVLYSTMILINLSMFAFVFPALANMNSSVAANKEKYDAKLSLSVDIPCSGHASLIADELKKENYIGQVMFRMPNIFDIEYDSSRGSPEEIFAIEIFKTYKATKNEKVEYKEQ